MSEPEQALLDRSVAGDEDALSELLGRHAPAIREKLRIDGKWLSKFDIDDVMQVTFLEAFQHIARFDPAAAGSFTGWLLQIARNNLRDLIKEAGRAKRPPPGKQVHGAGGPASYVAFVDVLSAASGTTPSRHFAAKDIKIHLERALAKLPEVYRQVVTLFDLDGQSVEQVAEAVGRSSGAVYMLRARAHDRLRGILGAESKFFSFRA
ncbi:MAG: sigma-70 family RNA polymerase sigma factor [Planctomycetes bacterium]|nr:sigma-70 family RNA polymerase sigma factor [Planctomycetota bacterium]